MRKHIFTIIIILILLIPKISQASRGCCSRHGGQYYCDTNVGKWVCNDGTYSSSCYCNKEPTSQIENNISLNNVEDSNNNNDKKNDVVVINSDNSTNNIENDNIDVETKTDDNLIDNIVGILIITAISYPIIKFLRKK